MGQPFKQPLFVGGVAALTMCLGLSGCAAGTDGPVPTDGGSSAAVSIDVRAESMSDAGQTALMVAEGMSKAGDDAGVASEPTAEEDVATASLTEEQLNSINMLNYLSVVVQDVNSSSDSRVKLEEVYSNLLNNTAPDAVDEATKWQLENILDTIQSFRMTDVKRDRIRYLYEQSQAQAIREAVPDPVALLSTVVGSGLNPVKAIATIGYMGIDAVTGYVAATSSSESQYIQSGWELDDQEQETLHASRKGMFSYMIQIVDSYGLPGNLTLSEEAVDDFVSWENNDNVVRRIRFLESNRDTYAALGKYWLVLAKSYYENGEYQKCLDAIGTYEGMSTGIFRRDYEYAKVLPLAISAASEVLSEDDYVSAADGYAQALLSNTGSSEWELRYVAAQTYVDLFARTGQRRYVQAAYDVMLDNVNYLIDRQQELNRAYLSPVKWETISEGMTDEERSARDADNKMLEKTRSTELPPVYQPLVVNCRLLFAISDAMGATDDQRAVVQDMLHGDGQRLFLVDGLDEEFGYDPDGDAPASTGEGISMSPGQLTIPVRYLTNTAHIKVTVLSDSGDTLQTYEDWGINRVDRDRDDEESSMRAVYTSDAAGSFDYQPGMSIVVEVDPCPENDVPTVTRTLHVTSVDDGSFRPFWDRKPEISIG